MCGTPSCLEPRGVISKPWLILGSHLQPQWCMRGMRPWSILKQRGPDRHLTPLSYCCKRGVTASPGVDASQGSRESIPLTPAPSLLPTLFPHVPSCTSCYYLHTFSSCCTCRDQVLGGGRWQILFCHRCQCLLWQHANK